MDARLIALTNVNLSEAVNRRNFREDLYYRLNVVHIHVPPLKERTKDLPHLIRSFVKTYGCKHGRDADDMTTEAMALLAEYEFPGNVRELSNTIERAIIVSASKRIEVADLPESVRGAVQLQRRKAKPQTLADLEAEYVRETLLATKGNKTEAARILGISRKNLYERLARMGEGIRMKDEG